MERLSKCLQLGPLTVFKGAVVLRHSQKLFLVLTDFLSRVLGTGTILTVPAVVDGRGSLSSHMRHLANEACHTVHLFKQSSSICSYLRNGLILHACMNNLL